MKKPTSLSAECRVHSGQEPISIDHVVIASSDLERSAAFYREVLGVTVISATPNFHQYRLSGQMLNVHGPGLVDATDPSMLARLPVRPGGSDLCFRWPGDIADACAHLDRCGVVVQTGPCQRSGARGAGVSVYFRDPDGTLLEFITYPAEDRGASGVPGVMAESSDLG